jgi:hypothetical protein
MDENERKDISLGVFSLKEKCALGKLHGFVVT